MVRKITELNELRAIELDIAKKIHEFCVERKIRYCLSCGSLIGAVRHRGFIPWDDDIDIFMPRPDYERFLDSFYKYGRNNLYIASIRSEHYFARTFSKVCDGRTVLTETELKDKEPIGVFVDVWPLDGLPDNPLARALHRLRAAIQYKSLVASTYRVECAHGKPFAKRAAIALGNCFDFTKIAAKLDKSSKKWPYETGRYVTCFARKYRRFEREYFNRLILSEFEDTQFYIPVNYDQILTLQYGDYLTLPKEDKRVPRHKMSVHWKPYNDAGEIGAKMKSGHTRRSVTDWTLNPAEATDA